MQDINYKRRQDIKPLLNKDFSQICTETNQPTEWLFGDNISDQLKNSRVTANVMRSTIKSSMRGNRFTPYVSNYSRGRALNYRAPLPFNRGGFPNQFNRRGNYNRRGFKNQSQQ
jgi:hypothetical protein